MINPSQVLWRGPTRWIERRVWRWHLRGESAGSRWLARLTGGWLRFRMRQAIRLRAARYSIPAALNRGLQTVLPFAAIIAATVPVWGMSWYFDTQNWAAAIWNSWAESRTDTHDFEYYAEPGSGTAPAVHHFVNGGGGAYLSFGSALAWPTPAATTEWAYYPDNAAVTQKIQARTPWWKRPAWWWTRSFGAWPFSAEWLSAAFDYNIARFFQSFVEIRVERSANRVRVIPYGVHGRLTWEELALSGQLRAMSGAAESATVEWVVPLALVATK